MLNIITEKCMKNLKNYIDILTIIISPFYYQIITIYESNFIIDNVIFRKFDSTSISFIYEI